jgi:hypothetical protein
MPRCALNLGEQGIRYAGLDWSAIGSRKYFTPLALSREGGLRFSAHSPSIVPLHALEAPALRVVSFGTRGQPISFVICSLQTRGQPSRKLLIASTKNNLTARPRWRSRHNRIREVNKPPIRLRDAIISVL